MTLRQPTITLSMPPRGHAASRPSPLPPPIRRQPNMELKPVPFKDEVAPGSTIHLGTCNGLGDIIWVYQKFAPYFDRINLTCISTTGSEVGFRSMPWLRLLPKVGQTSLRVEAAADYMRLVARPCTMEETIEEWKQNRTGRINYACNKWMEEGWRLDEIDPGSKVDWDLKIKSTAFPLPRPRYAILYVSGDTRHQHLYDNGTESIWSVVKWTRYIELLWQKWNLINLPIIVLGAAFDEPITMALFESIRSLGIDCGFMLGQPADKVVHLIKNADLFIGYQSGLSVVADLHDVRQIMLWFPRLKPMMYTFCKPGHEHTLYFPSCFADKPEAVIEAHQLWPTSHPTF